MPPLVKELAYVVIDTCEIDGWAGFARDILGFEVVRRADGAALRMDDRAVRYLLREAPVNGVPRLGWEVAGPAALDAAAARLTELGLALSPLDDGELAARKAAGGARFRCLNGIEHELAYGLADDGASRNSAAVSGFVTAPGGVGHVVWSVPDVAAMDRLLLDTLGMALREDIATPAGPGHFYGCNARHHSLAVFSSPALRIEHLMAEMKDLDDVGCAMDRAIDLDFPIHQPLGRHRTDHMLSFYTETPSGFGMEIGWGGVLCHDDWVDIREGNRRRPWGHGAAMRRHHKRRLAREAGEVAA